MSRKQLRPSNARHIDDRLKLHLRTSRADGREFHVITPRPGVRARFSTNYYHQTWHILSDPHGAHLLARLLWGLSYQRHPDTLIVIGHPHLDPNPFDAEPPAPIALVPADLTHLLHKTAHRVRQSLAAPGEPRGTVRWHTWGLDAEVARYHAMRADRTWWREYHPSPDGRGGEVDMIGGMLTFRGTPSLLRNWALLVATMRDDVYYGMSYTEIDHPDYELCRSNGEVQTFTDYHRRVSTAKVSRRETLTTHPTPNDPATLRPLIWTHNETVETRRNRPATNHTKPALPNPA
ncbi:hypothetical protein Aph01nite_39400 [Acrocarpospora phusangensis]|uniref:Uncharacterized protein n=1 Tax=Acrocarpospora phusangensis TaxID=1070424 RepID=A0A919QFN5_9ACTN|nr:hypothetical protein [Acrocarpospora phusangensis]GIH25630.1 hypothetical protein Aph01nite_39400 [Acrocarpospora phusangensis]